MLGAIVLATTPNEFDNEESAVETVTPGAKSEILKVINSASPAASCPRDSELAPGLLTLPQQCPSVTRHCASSLFVINKHTNTPTKHNTTSSMLSPNCLNTAPLTYHISQSDLKRALNSAGVQDLHDHKRTLKKLLIKFAC